MNKITIFAASVCFFIVLLVSYDFLSNKAEEEAKYWKGIKIVESRVWKGQTVHKLDDGSVVFDNEMENVWVQAKAEIWVIPKKTKEPENRQTYSIFRGLEALQDGSREATSYEDYRNRLDVISTYDSDKLAYDYDELADQVDKLQNRIYELENR